jgi:hypothetical protein
MTPAVASSTGAIRINIVDGTRKPLGAKQDSLIRILDGRHQQVIAPWVTGPSIRVPDLPYRDNLDDRYTVFVHSKGYEDAAIYPVQLKQGGTVDTNLMVLRDKPLFHFRPWPDMQSIDPQLLQLLTNGDASPGKRYADTMEKTPNQLGALLTIGTAVRDIALDDRTNPLQYYWEVIWDALSPDRFWAWVDARLADRIARMADLQAFAPETDAAHWHPGLPGHAPPVLPATRSWKQTRFDVTNVQMTFHEDDRATRKTPLGESVQCVVVEPDIDYYKDLLAHGLLEVLPNALTKGKTDPRKVYSLRWMATKQEGLAAFDPPVTVD